MVYISNSRHFIGSIIKSISHYDMLKTKHLIGYIEHLLSTCRRHLNKVITPRIIKKDLTQMPVIIRISPDKRKSPTAGVKHRQFATYATVKADQFSMIFSAVEIKQLDSPLVNPFFLFFLYISWSLGRIKTCSFHNMDFMQKKKIQGKALLIIEDVSNRENQCCVCSCEK